MKKTKKILSVMLVVMMLVAVVPLVNLGIEASAETYSFYTYSVTNGRATITDVDESIKGNIIIPGVLDIYPVTSIGEGAFSNCKYITSLEIPRGVTNIGNWAFDSCVNLVSVNIPDSVEVIGNYAFRRCESLTSLDIPNSVASIGASAFESCISLISINIPKGIKILESYVFWKCVSLTSIKIPESVTYIEQGAFLECESLTSIEFPDNLTGMGYNALNGCYSLTYVVLGDEINSILGGAFFESKSIKCVYYKGTEKQWREIYIEPSNENLINANIHFLCEAPYTEIRNATDSTCVVKGYTGDEYCRYCGMILTKGMTTPNTKHTYVTLNNKQRTCITCGENCTCNCHSGGISGFFFKILNFFQKLFGQNKVCVCGVAH